MHARSWIGGAAIALLAIAACPAPKSSPRSSMTSPSASATATTNAGTSDAAASEVATIATTDAGAVAATPLYAEDGKDDRMCSDALPAGTPPTFLSCAGAGACTTVARACCTCGVPERCDLYAVSVPSATALHDRLCPTAKACPSCAELPNPWLHAFCDAGTCKLVDLRIDAISACKSDDDCAARNVECCDDCDGTQRVIALRKDRVNDYRAQVCGKTKCAKCPVPPKSHAAICHPVRKHCVVSG